MEKWTTLLSCRFQQATNHHEFGDTTTSWGADVSNKYQNKTGAAVGNFYSEAFQFTS